MKLAIVAMLAIAAAGCGGRASAPVAAPPGSLPGFLAARWVPAQPLYVMSSPRLASAQHTVRAAIELAAPLTGVAGRDVSSLSSVLLGIDALDGDALAAAGVDLGGGWTVFGDASGPTLVVHLAAPAQMTAFIDRQRSRGLATRSVIVDRVELVTATLPIGATLSWAIDGDWMWVHLAAPDTAGDTTAWFTQSHTPHPAGWTEDWAWAERAAGAAAGVVGLFDLHDTVARLAARLPAAVACARLVEPVRRVSLALDGDERHISARIGVDIGSTDRVRSLVLAPPSGWSTIAGQAAIAAQWNLDLVGVRAALAPCFAAAGGAPSVLDQAGIRAARALVIDVDPDALSGTGAVALDVADVALFERQLDRIPLRKTLESARDFGPYHGHEIAIPFSVTIQYILEHQLAIAAIGDGLLARLVAPAAAGAAAGAPIAAIDVAPPAMPVKAWQAVVQALAEQRISDAPGRRTQEIVEHLMRWRDAHVAVTADGGELTITASARRR